MSRWRQAMVLAGGLALLGATAIDALSVTGRQIGVPLRGSIELVQVAVLVAGGMALLLATVDRAHSSVHLLLDRLGEATRHQLGRLFALLGALFFAAMLAGASWLMIDLWPGHERSEVMAVDWRWLRLFVVLVLAAIMVVMLGQAIRRRP